MKLQESERTEFKSIVVTDIKKEIIAFANCDGGKIYIGIEDDGTVIGVEDSDSVALQVSNMIRDAIKPDLTMFLHYETKEIEQKQVVIIDIQRGTERPYYIAKKGLRPEGVYVRQGYSSVPATDTAIRKMIKETDGDHFEDMRSLDQELTFCETKKEFQKRNITLERPQMKTLGIINQDGIYTNLASLLSDQCVHTIKTAVFEGKNQNIFKDRKEFTGSVLKQVNDTFEYLDLYNKTKGKIIGLLGKNGMGKTTLIKLINDLLTPTSGEVLINGEKPGVNSKKIISYLPERTYLDKNMNVSQIITFFNEFYDNFNEEKAIKLLKDLDLDINLKINKMSKGMQEKLQLILVMSREAELYILDEPLGGVDPATRDYILDTILLNFNEGASLIISTHIISDVERILDDVIFIDKGEIILTSSADELRKKESASIDEIFRRCFKC